MPSRRAAACQRCSNGSSKISESSQGTVSQAFWSSFLVELAGFPAGVAERDDRLGRAVALRHRGEDVAGGRDVQRVRHLHRGFESLRTRTVQHEAAVALHGAAARAPACRAAARPRSSSDELLEHLGHPHFERAVDHDAERAALVVLADERDAVREIRVRERRHRDQQLVAEIGACCHGASIGRGPAAVKAESAGAFLPAFASGLIPAYRRRRALRRRAREPSADELPFVGESQHVVPRRQLLRERLERRRELQYVHCGAVELAVAARTADVGAHEAAVRGEHHLDHADCPTACCGAPRSGN